MYQITWTIKKLKKKKTPGVDRIRKEMLKCGGDKLIPILFKLFNLIVNSGIYPDIWTKGVITAIYKSGDRSNPSNLTIQEDKTIQFTKNAYFD